MSDAIVREDMDVGEKEGDSGMESVPENGFNIVDFQDLDKSDLDAMKGDTVGDTVYSSKWILKTLISFSKISEGKLSEITESDLCTLWDMTAEKDVVYFLMENDFLKIAECILKISQDPRLTEIILGVIANMCCDPTVLEALATADDLLSIIFGLLSTDDTETLVQILRLLQIFVWDVRKNVESKWLQRLKNCEFLGDGISFILQSSTNENLLTSTVDFVQSISNISLPDDGFLLSDLMKIDQLVPALVECFCQLIPEDDVNFTRCEFKFIENWLAIFSNMLRSKADVVSSEFNDEIVEKLTKILSKILQPYTHSGNLFPLDGRLATCIHDCVEMTSWFQRNNKNRTDAKVVCVIVTIMHELRSAIKTNSEACRIVDMDEAKELSSCTEEFCLETLRTYEENELMSIFHLCHQDVIECLMDVAEEYSQRAPDAVAKLLRIECLSLNR